MSELVPSVLPLDKGLDLQTAKIIAQPGTVLDTLNYEQVDFQGQKRIDGYTRYDGSALSAFDDYAMIEFTPGGCFGGIPTTVSYPVYINDVLWGITLAPITIDEEDAYVAIINHSVKPKPGDDLRIGGQIGNTLDTFVMGKDSGVTAEQHYTKLLELLDLLRQRVESLPGPIAGLHWFRDRLYCVADTCFISVTPANGVLIRPNDTLAIGFSQVKVYDVFDDGNGDQIVLIQTASDSEVFDGEFVNVVFEPFSQFAGIARAVSYPEGLTRYATFFESRSERQVIYSTDGDTTDFGWRAKHLGWVVAYEDGLALYGDLTALNQNRQNVGIQGPTDISGTNGSPAVLTQKVTINNRPQQVNGWKSTDTPTNYILDATDVQQIDTKYAYADAFISWTADSAAVSTPGSDMNGLVEYSPTSTIRYTPLP